MLPPLNDIEHNSGVFARLTSVFPKVAFSLTLNLMVKTFMFVASVVSFVLMHDKLTQPASSVFTSAIMPVGTASWTAFDSASSNLLLSNNTPTLKLPNPDDAFICTETSNVSPILNVVAVGNAKSYVPVSPAANAMEFGIMATIIAMQTR